MKVDVEQKFVGGRLQVHIDLKGDLPGHPFRGNQWSGGQVSDVNELDDKTLESVFGIRRRQDAAPEGGIRSQTFQGMGSVEEWEVRNSLAKEAGIRPDDAKKVMMPTLFQPFNSSYAGTGVVASVSRTLGIDRSPHDLEKEVLTKAAAKDHGKRNVNNDVRANGFSMHARLVQDSDVDKLVSATYERTQRTMKESGVTEVTLYRGMGKDRVGGKSNTLESWTADKQVAEGFAKEMGGKLEVATFPASRIFATPASGWGVANQAEVIVLGNEPGRKSAGSRMYYESVDTWENWLKSREGQENRPKPKNSV